MLGLKPIKTLPIREKIAATLREAILSRKIPAGEVLTLESTAQELGVSITPVRKLSRFLQGTVFWN
ncbi:MAG: GntR family transcriptional regulator [Blautia faecis]